MEHRLREDWKEITAATAITLGLIGIGAGTHELTKGDSTQPTTEALPETPSTTQEQVSGSDAEQQQAEFEMEVAHERMNAQAVFAAHGVLDQLEDPTWQAQTDGAYIGNKAAIVGEDLVAGTADDSRFSDLPEARANINKNGKMEFLSVNHHNAQYDAEGNYSGDFKGLTLVFDISEATLNEVQTAAEQGNISIQLYRDALLAPGTQLTILDVSKGASTRNNLVLPKLKEGEVLPLGNREDILSLYANDGSAYYEVFDTDNPGDENKIETAAELNSALDVTKAWIDTYLENPKD